VYSLAHDSKSFPDAGLADCLLERLCAALAGKTSLENPSVCSAPLTVITFPYPSPPWGLEEFQKFELLILKKHLEGQQ